MGDLAREIQRPVLDAYDLSNVGRLVDIGGAHGHLVAAILSRYPKMQGVVFDLPNVVPGAAAVLIEAGVADRAEVIGGDYLCAVPPDADAYTVSHVLHQLSDAEAITVLSNIRQVMDPAGQVLIIDPVLPEGNVPRPGKFMDITMMMLTQGRDRTEAELADLFKQADLKHVKTIALSAPSSVSIAMRA
jgi:O-methyltransferase domain